MNTRGPLLCLLAATALPGLMPALSEPARAATEGFPGDASFVRLADEYIDDFYLPENPTQATALGVHRFDGRLENYGRAAVTSQVRRLEDWERRLAAVDAATLSERVAGDRELLLSNVRSTLLTLETIRPWQNNPDIYPSGIAQSAFVIMERSFAPPAVRLRSLIERERSMPVALMQAHQNLDDPPEIFTRIALEQLPGTIDFFEHDVPAAFAAAKEPALQARFRRSNAAVVGALRHYQHWLTRQVLPRSHGDFRIGAKAFGAKLLYDEMVDTPLDRLLEIGNDDLRRNQQAFLRVAHELEPAMSSSDVVAELDRDRPAPDQLLSSFRATFDSLIEFIGTHRIITVPDAPRPIVEDTPPFERATSMASMDTPGPFERSATEAYFNVTPPEANWDALRVADFMAGYSYPVISNTAVHEAYPGHYVQYLWIQRLDDRVRQVFGAATNYEGWAHYCEQMMLDQGFGQAGPEAGADELRRSRLLRLGQLRDALLRDARFVVGIRMHTGSMSLPQAIDFFHDQGYQTREVGELEARRGASDPTYLYYTLGKLQILKLRADLVAREGAQFDLQRFHDDFMRQGQAPIKLVRRALLHDDSPTL